MYQQNIVVKPFASTGFSRLDLMTMEPELLRALLRERVHHTIEVPLYSILAKGQPHEISNFGNQPEIILEVWYERGFSENEPDIQWAIENLNLALKIRQGEIINFPNPLPVPFTEDEMKVVNKLLYGRSSCRDWLDKPVPEEMIQQILEAGRAAPIGCNLNEIRFLVLRDPTEHKMIWSDISTKNSVIIVICVDQRIPKIVSQDKYVPQNPAYDAAAAADHMLLMAHALGLGGVWLSKTAQTEFTEDTGKQFSVAYGLPDYIDVALHIAVGWPAIGAIKSQRMPLSEMIIT